MKRTVWCALLAVTSVFAQDSAPANSAGNAAGNNANNAAVEALRKRLQDLDLLKLKTPGPAMVIGSAPVAAPPKLCSIPLLQVVPPGTTDKMRVVAPHAPVLRGDTVQVPAPPCTNWNANVTAPAASQPPAR